MADEERIPTIGDVLVQTLASVSALGFHAVSREARDLDQARLAVEALRALTPVLRGAVADELVRDLESATASLQLAYADAVAEPKAPGSTGPPDAE